MRIFSCVVVALFLNVISFPVRAEFRPDSLTPYIPQLGRIRALDPKSDMKPADLAEAIKVFRGWVGSPGLKELTPVERVLLENSDQIIEMKAALDARVVDPAIQRKLIASGMLNGEIGRVAKYATLEAVQRLRRATALGSAGDLNDQELQLLDELERKIDTFAGFEKIANPETGITIMLPKAIVGGEPEKGVNKIDWTTFANKAGEFKVHLFKHGARANTSVSLAQTLIDRKQDINFQFLEMTGDGFTIEATAQKNGVKYINHSRAWNRSGRIIGFGLSVDLDPLPSFSAPQMPDPDAGLDKKPGSQLVTPETRNWNVVANAIINLMASDFERLNGWEEMSSKECRTKANDDGKAVAIIFATDRRQAKEAASSVQEADKLYLSERDDALHFGCAVVFVPTSAQNATDLRALIGRGPRGGPANQPDKHFHVASTEMAAPVLPGSGRDLQLTGEGNDQNLDRGLLFIHGYNSSFADALLRVAQIAAAIDYPGRVYLFSWPSHESRISYAADMDLAEQAEVDLQYFMKLILRDANLFRLDIMAHSMGSQILLRSIDSLKPAFDRRIGPERKDRVRLGQVIFAAPDVSELVFVRKVNVLRQFAERVTVYASANDGALDVSQLLRGRVPRAGSIRSDKTPIYVEDVQFIDITGETLPWYNIGRYYGPYHSAFAYEAPVLEDMKALLKEGARGRGIRGTPMRRAERANLAGKFEEKKYPGTENKFWVLVPLKDQAKDQVVDKPAAVSAAPASATPFGAPPAGAPPAGATQPP